ncbi:MAG: ABC transporter permease, partial [Polyangiaceae bacterium]
MKASSSRLLVRLAWRNLGRNHRRTIITGAAIVLGVGLCIAMSGLVDGLDADIVASVTDVDLGDVQVHRPGYLERRALSLAIDGGERKA